MFYIWTFEKYINNVHLCIIKGFGAEHEIWLALSQMYGKEEFYGTEI